MNDSATPTRLSSVEYDPFAGVAVAKVASTTEAQREVWLACSLGSDASLAYNESISLHLKGFLQEVALLGALQDLVDRHDALRSTFSADGQTLFIAEEWVIHLSRLDLSHLTADERQKSHRGALKKAVETPFDLERGPMLRFELLALAADEHVLVFSVHHIVCDGWSFGVLVKELASLYSLRAGRGSRVLEHAPSFADYAGRLTTEEHRRQVSDDEAYWVSVYDESVPVLELPCDRSRGPGRSFASEREDIRLDEPLVHALRKLGAGQGASLFVTLLALFSALLARLSGSAEVVVGVPAAGQANDGSAALVGHCVNLLPIRVVIELERDVATTLRSVGSTVLDAYDHQHCTFGRLLQRLQVRRDPSRLPLVSVLFNLETGIDTESLSDQNLRWSIQSNPRSSENFDLFMNACHTSHGMVLECQFKTDLFDSQTVRRWLALFKTSLERASADPGLSLALCLVPTAVELVRMADLNKTAMPVPEVSRVEDLVARQFRISPDKVAICVAGREITYRQVQRGSDRLALALGQHDIGPGDLVGLCCGRNEHMVMGMLGVLKSGAAYVPLDPGFPSERLDFMASDAALRLVVCDRTTVDMPQLPGMRRLLVEDLASDEPVAAPVVGDSSAVAYVIYTSGSTGRPKGVAIPHSAVLNFLASMASEPGLSSDDRLLAVTTLSFDIAVLELLLPLTVGATVVLAGPEQVRDGALLEELLSESAVTVMQATPSTWRLLIDSGWSGREGLRALVGGEALSVDLARALLARRLQLWNMYGPTETTVWSCIHHVQSADAAIPIGHPIGNTHVHVVDSRLRPLPLGVVGELFIGGRGVARGYIDRPELTEDRFPPDPFSAQPGARGYRTGDLGRWRNDGVLECLGRTDQQVKVRGYRIELGEIESCLVTHPNVAQTAVVRREDRPGDVRLAAYVVLRTGCTFESQGLVAHLQSLLPDYMVPQHFIAISALPRLPNGKLDRHSLPAPDVAPGPATGPRPLLTATERLVAQAMENALSLPGIQLHDDFFALGGHSLLAVRLAREISQAMGIQVPLRAVFGAATVHKLAIWLDAAAERDAHRDLTMRAHAESEDAPTTVQQQRLWFLDRLNPGRLTYNTPSAHRLLGPLDPAALESSFNALIGRQAVLRTCLVDLGGLPRQRILPSLTISLGPAVDLSMLPVGDRLPRLKELLQQRASEGMDLTQAPLFRMGLYRLDLQEHVLFFMPHHAIWDGWSFDLLYEELAGLYSAYSDGQQPSLPLLEASYADFARWQETWLLSSDLREQVDSWKLRLEELPEPLALPKDRPRPARMSGEGATHEVVVSQALNERVRRLGQAHGATLFMALLATYALLLHRLTGQRKFMVGTPVRGRDSSQTEKIMGFFVNALPLRLQVDPDQSFVELLQGVKAEVLESLSAPDVPFESLVRELALKRDESRSPIYQAFFSYQDARKRSRRWGGLRQEQVHIFQPGASEDLGLWFLEHPEGLAGGLSYNTDILSAKTARRLVERLDQLLNSVVDDPYRSVGSLTYLPAEECATLDSWNATEASVNLQTNVADLLSAQARRTPHRPALRFDGQDHSYGQLESSANRLANLLRAKGIGVGALVGLCLERSPEMLVAQLAILKSGAAYVPLDPSYPPERLSYMSQDANLALVISHSLLVPAALWPRAKCLLLDLDQQALESQPDSAVRPDTKFDAKDTDPAYVIYTSGSTGKPKGVVVPHRAVVNFLTSMAHQPGLSPDDRLVAVTTLSFDIAVLELLLPLSRGALVVLASQGQAIHAQALAALLASSQATIMQATPSTWRLLVDSGWQGVSGLKALVGGESLPSDLADQLVARCASVWNMYGPTETTVWSTCWKVETGLKGVRIGRPIANTFVQILDTQGQACGIGVEGEIFIGGAGLATGYLHRPDLTADRFIVDPARPGRRLYRTGDRGRWDHHGQLEHLGRLDHQVKLRGHRIEPGEIEAALATHPEVSQVLVLVREVSPGDARLVAYLVSPSEVPSESELRRELRKVLPEFMLPQHFVQLDQFPLLPNGKVDRGALAAPKAATPDQAAHDSLPLSEDAAAIATIWAEVLGINQPGAADNFYDLGGHSLLALRVVAEIERRLGKKIDLRRLIYESVAQIASTPVMTSAQVKPRMPMSTGLFSRLRRRLGRSA